MANYAVCGQVKITSGYADATIIGSISETTGRFTTVESTVITGTAPLIVASRTEVVNLRSEITSSLATNAGPFAQVNIVSNPPTAGQVLTATSATTAEWKDIGSKINYTLAINKINIPQTAWITIAYFPWENTKFAGYINGEIICRVTIVDRNLDIRFRDTTNNITLGSLLNISTTGTKTFTITNPGSDAEVELQVQKINIGGTNPTLTGVILEYVG